MYLSHVLDILQIDVDNKTETSPLQDILPFAIRLCHVMILKSTLCFMNLMNRYCDTESQM